MGAYDLLPLSVILPKILSLTSEVSTFSNLFIYPFINITHIDDNIGVRIYKSHVCWFFIVMVVRQKPMFINWSIKIFEVETNGIDISFKKYICFWVIFINFIVYKGYKQLFPYSNLIKINDLFNCDNDMCEKMNPEYYFTNKSSVMCSAYQHDRIRAIVKRLPDSYILTRYRRYRLNDALEIAIQLLERELGMEQKPDPDTILKHGIVQLDRVLKDLEDKKS